MLIPSPPGEGAPQGRVRAELRALARKSPHPAVPATFSPREKEGRPRRACNSTVKRARKAKQIVHSSLDNQPSVQCGFPDWGRGFRDHHRWVPSEAQLIHKSRPNQVLNLSRKGKEDLIESMGLYQ